MKSFAYFLNQNCALSGNGIPLPIADEVIVEIVYDVKCILQDAISQHTEVFDSTNVFLTNKRLVVIEQVNPQQITPFFVALESILEVSLSHISFMLIDGSMGLLRIIDEQYTPYLIADIKNVISKNKVDASSDLDQSELPTYFQTCLN